jgi:hypothetical protein
MTEREIRIATWGGVTVVLAILVFSIVQQSVGYETFHEVACETEPRRTCAPTGSRVVATRDAAKREVRIEEFGKDGRLAGRQDLKGCTIRDSEDFVCRKSLALGLSGDNHEPWRMAHGRLYNAERPRERIHYLNSLQLWRNRLFLGSYEY